MVVEDLSIDDAARLRKHLVKHFGGASEDVKERELLFDEGLPDKPGGKAFLRVLTLKSSYVRSSLNGLSSPECVL